MGAARWRGGKQQAVAGSAGNGGKRREVAAQGQWLAQKKVGDKSRTMDRREVAGSGRKRRGAEGATMRKVWKGLPRMQMSQRSREEGRQQGVPGKGWGGR
jgi:hypothetical protein